MWTIKDTGALTKAHCRYIIIYAFLWSDHLENLRGKWLQDVPDFSKLDRVIGR
jgi:hypothetical protein